MRRTQGVQAMYINFFSMFCFGSQGSGELCWLGLSESEMVPDKRVHQVIPPAIQRRGKGAACLVMQNWDFHFFHFRRRKIENSHKHMERQSQCEDVRNAEPKVTEYLIPIPHRDMMPPHSFIKSGTCCRARREFFSIPEQGVRNAGKKKFYTCREGQDMILDEWLPNQCFADFGFTFDGPVHCTLLQGLVRWPFDSHCCWLM